MSSNQIRSMQKAMNKRLAARHRDKITEDGILGPKTTQAVHVLKYLLGFPKKSLDTGPSLWFRSIVKAPGLRPPTYESRARDRKAYLTKEADASAGVASVGKGDFGIDWAWGQASYTALKVAGVKFACRYFSHDKTKNLTPQEAKMLSSTGIGIVAVWEQGANNALKGFRQGQLDGAAALAQANSCGMPAGRPIYAAVDFDATPVQQPAIDAYLRGFRSALRGRPVGVYGSYYVVERCLHVSADFGWQTYAWSGGLVSTKAHILQYSNGHKLAGVSCDYNRALKGDFGEWRV